MSYQEIIQANQQIILDLYYKEGLKKSHIAHKLIQDLDLDFSHGQADSFRRAVSQYLIDYEQQNPEASKNVEAIQPIVAVDKYPNAIRTRAKVLLIDVETTPIFGAFWGIRKQHLNIDNIITDSHLLCWAGKWLFDPVMVGDCLTPEEAINHDDSRLCQGLWDILDEADIIIAHNGRRFDIPVINGRFLINKFKSPPSPYEIIDTLLSSRQAFRLSSHKLDYINRVLGVTTKLDTDFKLWLDCAKGIPSALVKMYTYCQNDTAILEETYMEMRPWIKAHPNMAFYVESDKMICPTCGCTELVEKGTYRTIVNEYAAYSCPNCGAQGRSRKSSTTLQKKQSVMVSLGR